MKKFLAILFLIAFTPQAFCAYVPNNVKAEDSASADGDNLTPVGAVRKATPANTSGADGDYEPLQMSAGRVWASTTIDSALPAGNNNIGDVDVASMPTTTVTATNLDVQIGGSDTVVVDSELASAAALADATANPTITGIGTYEQVFNGTTWDRVRTVVNGQNTTGTGIMASGILGQLDDTSPGAVTENQFAPVRLSTRRALLVEGVASGTAQAVSVASGSIASGAIASGAIAAGAFATGATSVAADEDSASANADRGFKIHQVRLDTPVSGANASGSGDYIPFISDSFGKTWTAGTYAEDLAHTDLEAITATGERRIDTLATSAGTSGDWATSNQSAEGAQWATLSPTTTSGLSVANFTSGDTFTALTNTAQAIKASAGNLYGYYIYNPNSSAVYVNLYNVASASVTVGTTTPLMNLAIPASSGANLMFPYPITFSNAGWSASCTTTGGGNTAPTTACEAMFFYK